MRSGVATVEFGDNESRMVYKDLLCDYSPFFKKALTGAFKEGQESQVRVEGYRGIIFEFLNWLHQRTIPKSAEDLQLSTYDHTAHVRTLDLDGEVDTSPLDVFLIDLFIFADKYDVPLLRDDVMRVLHERYNDATFGFMRDELFLITSSLPSSSTLFRFAIKVTVARMHRGRGGTPCDMEQRDFDVSFWRAVALGMMKAPEKLPGVGEYLEFVRSDDEL